MAMVKYGLDQKLDTTLKINKIYQTRQTTCKMTNIETLKNICYGDAKFRLCKSLHWWTYIKVHPVFQFDVLVCTAQTTCVEENMY